MIKAAQSRMDIVGLPALNVYVYLHPSLAQLVKVYHMGVLLPD
jgi:hypothetical protein